MNPHHLHFDQREWLENICIIPLIFSAFPIPLAMPIVMFSFYFDDKWQIPTIFFTWLGLGIYITYLNEREKRPPKWARKLFKV